MLSEKSPYVVTLLVALITWVATEYYEITSRTGFISIKTARLQTDSDFNWILEVKNLSKRVTIRKIDLSVQCDVQPCFTESAEGNYAQDVHVPPLMVGFSKQYEAAVIGMTQLNMPPQSAFRVNFKTPENVDRVSSLLQNNSDINVTPVDGCGLKDSFDCFFAANFLGSMFFFWALATLTVFRLMTVGTQTVGHGSPEQDQSPHSRAS